MLLTVLVIAVCIASYNACIVMRIFSERVLFQNTLLLCLKENVYYLWFLWIQLVCRSACGKELYLSILHPVYTNSVNYCIAVWQYFQWKQFLDASWYIYNLLTSEYYLLNTWSRIMEIVSLLMKLIVCMALLFSKTAAQSDDGEGEHACKSYMYIIMFT